MFSSLKLKTQWHAEAEDERIIELAEICALFRVVGVNKKEDFVEKESDFYIDKIYLASNLYTEITKYKDILDSMEVTVLFYSISESFMKSHTHDGKLLIDGVYSAAMKNYVSPLQTIRSIEIPEYSFGSEKSIYNEICCLPDYLGEPTDFDTLVKEIGSVKL